MGPSRRTHESRNESASRSNQSRRKFLTAVGAASVLGLAGCSGDGGNGGGNGNGADTDTPTQSGNGNGNANDFPSEDISLIVPFGPGGGTDTYARHFAPETSKHLDAEIAIENVEGAGGALGMTQAYQSEPDGHTLGFGVPPGTSMLGYVADPDSFDIKYEEFEPVGTMGENTNVIMANPDQIGDATYEDVVGMYQDGELTTLGAHQPGQATHVASLVAKDQHGLDYQDYVSYSGSGEIAQAVASGEIPIGLVSEPTAIPFQEDGSARVIADVSSRGGLTLDIPSVADYGFEPMDYLLLSRCWLAPPDTPEGPRQVIADALKQACNADVTDEWVEETGNVVTYGGIEETRERWHGTLESIPENVPMDLLREEMGVE